MDDIEEVWNEDDLYINQFIRLVKAIEDYNPGLRINVILCLNIFSEPQENWKAVVDYLRDEDLNHQYSVNVVGIEVGNETYMDVFGDALGFEMSDGVSAFEHYWAYINGVDDYSTEFTNDDDFTLSDVLTNNGMVGHHDFLGEFKNDEDYDFLKLGLPAENADVDDGAFIIGDDEDQPIDLEIPVDCSSWNTCLYQHYNDLISGKPAFDAVIPHEYYKAQNSGTPAYNTNWGEIPLCLDNVAGGDHQNFNTDLYTYATADARLSCAFDNLVTTGTGTKNFREFITSRQRDAVLDLSIELGFDDSEPHPKECWVNEWNLKNNSNYADDAEGDAKDLRRDVYMNSFAHAYLLQEEMLNYMKFNCHTSLREGFMPYTTLQNFLDGSATDLVRLSSLQDQIENDIYTSCTGGLGYNYYMARTTYYSTRLMNQIALLDLDFLKTTSLIYTSNVNKSVTFFSKELENEAETQTVYGYFTNVKDEPETYIIKPGTFTGVSLAGTQAEIHCVQAKRLYSRSGMGAVYEINDEYGCDAGGIADFFEIKGELAPYMDNTTCPINMPSGAMCVNVPAYSCGYFVFTFDIGLRLGDPLSQYNLYPNPASTNFSIQQTNAEINNIEDLEIDIYNINGVLIQTIYNVYEGKSIDVTQLPVGVYNVLIKPKGSPTESETLVKMK